MRLVIYMTVLLISIDAKYIHTNNAVRLLKANSSFAIDIKEYTIKDHHSTIVKDILESHYDVIGFSVYIWNVSMMKAILPQLKNSGKTIILGGPEVSYDPQYFLSFDAVECIVRGEGEGIFDTLLQRLANHQSYGDLPNIAYRLNGEIIVQPIEEITDLSQLNPPYFMTEDLPHIQQRISYIESSRGCPYHCSYCLSSLEKTVRFFPVETVKQAIKHIMDHGGKTIKFLDRTFNANRKTMEILQYIIEQDNHQTVFQFEITGDILSNEIIDYLHAHARKGLFRFEIGIQSANDETNYLVDRHQNTDKLFDRIIKIQEAGIIDLHLDLIAGLPKEDKTSFIQTFNSVFLLGAKELQLGFLKMLRGTKIRTFAYVYGYVYDEEAPYEIIQNNVLTKADIEEIKHVEHMLEIYHNKGYFGSYLHNYILRQPSPYHFFLQLAQWYQNNQWQYHGYQIVDVYQRLLDVLPPEFHYGIYQEYLLRSKIKPQIFFQTVTDKELRKTVYEIIETKHNISRTNLYKHSVLLEGEDEFFCAYYQDLTCTSYIVKAPK